MDIRSLLNKLDKIESSPTKGDGFLLEFSNKLEVETEVLEITESGDIVILGDDKLIGLLENAKYDDSHGSPYDRGRADSYYGRRANPHKYVDKPDGSGRVRIELTDPEEIEAYKTGYRENDDFKDYGESLEEAEYHGRKVPLGKPMKGDVKKSKVYVKNPATGKIVKVNFGDKTMRIKKSNPERRKSFRARHNCANPGPRTKARYWSCRAW